MKFQELTIKKLINICKNSQGCKKCSIEGCCDRENDLKEIISRLSWLGDIEVFINQEISLTKSNIKDKNGVEIEVGQTLAFPYIDPMGNTHKDEKNFEAIVVFKHGCFGYETLTSFEVLMSWSKARHGAYVSNVGLENVILDEYPFWVINIENDRK